MRKSLACFVLAATFGGSAAAQTETESASPFTLDSSATVVSDYRFRGWSLSDEKPALQIESTLTHESGLYAGVFASSIEEIGVGADGDGARTEFDLSTGWGFSLAGFDIDAGAMAYLYPDANDVNYYVLPVSVSRAFGGVSLTLGYEYTPRQTSLGDLDGSYVWFGANWSSEDLPFWLSTSVGYEDGAWAPAGKTDWSLGAFYDFESIELGLSYTGADDPAAGDALVAEIRNSF